MGEVKGAGTWSEFWVFLQSNDVPLANNMVEYYWRRPQPQPATPSWVREKVLIEQHTQAKAAGRYGKPGAVVWASFSVGLGLFWPSTRKLGRPNRIVGKPRSWQTLVLGVNRINKYIWI